MERILFYFAMLYQGDWDSIYNAIKNMEEVNQEKYQEFANQIKCNYITLLSPFYPERLKYIDHPPFVLFYYGNINLLLNNNIIGIIGSRDRSNYGQEKAKEISRYIVEQGYITISGMAKGIDSDCHNESLETKIDSTIAVLSFGIDYCYPRDSKDLKEKIKDKGLIISEYPGEVLPNKKKNNFRSRMVAGLSKGIAVIECKMISGVSITVAYGLENGRDIFAVPNISKVYNGTNALIKKGAMLIEDGKDIISYYEN